MKRSWSITMYSVVKTWQEVFKGKSQSKTYVNRSCIVSKGRIAEQQLRKENPRQQITIQDFQASCVCVEVESYAWLICFIILEFSSFVLFKSQHNGQFQLYLTHFKRSLSTIFIESTPRKKTSLTSSAE